MKIWRSATISLAEQPSSLEPPRALGGESLNGSETPVRKSGTSICRQSELHGVGQLRVDVTDAGQIADAVAQLQEETSRLDILVNNAGFTGGSLTVEQLDPADWRRIIEVNLTGVFEVTRHVVPVMRHGGWGRIVNMAPAGKDGSPNLSAYSAAKAGVIAFTKSLGTELVGYHQPSDASPQ